MSSFFDALSSNRESGNYTDFTIVCQGHEFPVNRLILACHSKVFAVVLRRSMREATSGRYEMNEEDLFMVRRMIQFMYSGDYDDQPKGRSSENRETASELQIHARMFALAGKYQIDDLAILSAERYRDTLYENLDNEEFLGSILDVFKSTPDSERYIRDIALNYAKENLGEPLTKDDTLKRKYDETVKDTPNFARELLESCLKVPLVGHCDYCGPGQPMDAVVSKCKLCKHESSQTS